ncbi:hypothetical protein IE53DRAFT_369016 [Violaceomyces palustris]|uniref:Uncharacterized protein n=1 Tax=Violaceomyces palustris TaxID=1673888 RepID=A0ACD0NWV0_9BASI|nr:hypothetical protein IE53DRAFT_369016 [Violaceomyces palustris]
MTGEKAGRDKGPTYQKAPTLVRTGDEEGPRPRASIGSQYLDRFVLKAAEPPPDEAKQENYGTATERNGSRRRPNLDPNSPCLPPLAKSNEFVNSRGRLDDHSERSQQRTSSSRVENWLHRIPSRGHSYSDTGDALSTASDNLREEHASPSKAAGDDAARQLSLEGFQGVRDGKKYRLVIAQNPSRCRSCGFGDKDRRPLSPTLIVKLVITDASTGAEIDPFEIDTSLFVLNADLCGADGPDSPPCNILVHRHLPAAPPWGSSNNLESKQPTFARNSACPAEFDNSTQGLALSPADSADHATNSSYHSSGTPPSNLVSTQTSRINSGSEASAHESRFSGSKRDPMRSAKAAGASITLRPSFTEGVPVRAPPLEAQEDKSTVPNLDTLHIAGIPWSNGKVLPVPPFFPAAPIPLRALKGTGLTPAYPNPSERVTRNLVGCAVASASVLRDVEDNWGIFFVLQDISVRTEGVYRIRLTFVNLGMNGRVNIGHSPALAETFTEPFQAYSPRRFPGMLHPSPLSRKLASQGVKIPVRLDLKKKKKKGRNPEDDGNLQSDNHFQLEGRE